MATRWIVPNGRGRVLLMLDTLHDKQAFLAALSGRPSLHSPDAIRVFQALLISNVAFETEMSQSSSRIPDGEGA